MFENILCFLLQLFDTLNFEDVGSFLPPGFNPEGPPPSEEKQAKEEKKADSGPKLGLSSLFDNIETPDISALLPPGFNPDGPPPPEQEEKQESKVKLPPTFGTASKGSAYSPKPKGPPKGGGLVIPKIKSFADR